jgi:crotonobetainyl-CoA:carnitine CoA-transferase CaiB-like acyl-CoA transferase
MFNSHARNKLSMTVDLNRAEGMDIFRRLIRVSDVFIENNAPGTMEKMGITYEMLKQEKPNIIMVRMPGFGLYGPYRDYRGYGPHFENTIGHASLRGYPDMDPTTLTPDYHCDASAGACAAMALVMALRYRNKTGKGQFIEVGQIETMIPHLGQAIMDCVMNGRVQRSAGNHDPGLSMAPHSCYRCKGEDRWINIAISGEEQWRALCRVMGNPAWASEECFSDVLGRWKHQHELDRLIEAWTLEHDHIALMHMLQGEGVPAGAVLDARDCYNDPHLKERGFFEELTQVDCGTHLYPGLAWRMPTIPNRLRLPPCRLGEHNEYVYKKVIGVSDEEYARLEAERHMGMDFVPEIP